jgi:hypothetical protein
MNGRLLHRIALALIPVAMLTTVSLAFSVATRPPVLQAQAPAPLKPITTTETTPPPVPAPEISRPQPADAPAAQPEDYVVEAQDQAVEIVEIAEEPLPELIVDRAPLVQALAELDRAAEQAKLAVTALDPTAQTRYIQETVNVLAGFADPMFHAVTITASTDTYRGVRPLLIEARVTREAAEVQWIAAVQQQMEARARKLAEIAQAGGSVALPPAAATMDLSAVVGPTGVLGTRGVRVEEQAAEIVGRAIRQAAEALRTVPAQNVERDTPAVASEQATSTMEYVVRQLETARKIVQIAIDR